MIELQKEFIERGLTLALAESCTGGLIASMLTKTAGSSNYFLGSFVTYSEKLKVSILGVSEETLKKKTAVSREVAEQMCLGALQKSGSDFALSVTGDAGPDGEQVGTVYGALGSKDKIFVSKIPNLKNLSRNEIQQKVSEYLLSELLNFVKTMEAPFAH